MAAIVSHAGPGGPTGHVRLDDEVRKRLKTRDAEENRAVLHWIAHTSKQHLPGVIALMVTSALSALAGVLFALSSQQAINAAVAGDAQSLLLFACALGGVGVIQILIRAFSSYWSEVMSARVENAYRARLFDAILTRDYQQVTAHHSGDLMNRMTDDVGVVVSGVTTFLPSIAEIIASLISAGSVLLITDWRFCVLYVAATVALIVITRVFRRAIKTLSAFVREKDGETRAFFQDAIASLLVQRVFVTEDRARTQSTERLADFYNARMARSKVHIKSNAMMGLSMNFGHVFALIWCSFQLIAGNISYGALVAIMQLTGQVRMPFISASNLSSQYYAMIASGERLMEIEALQPELSEEDRSVRDSGFDARDLYGSIERIHINDLSFSYGDEATLRGVSATIERGDIVAITGQSGCGKSTLFKIMMGVLRPDTGSARIEGAGNPPSNSISCGDTWSMELGPLTRRLFAYVPQGNLLITGRLRDNIAFAKPDATEDEIWEACRIACADEFVADLPDGLDTVVGEGGAGLSGGQMQRIAVARAYLSGAPIMLLDEATSSLDEATEAQLLANLQQLGDRTCIIVTHRPAALGICNKSLQLQDGSIPQAA